jgi:hypothetical protein
MLMDEERSIPGQKKLFFGYKFKRMRSLSSTIINVVGETVPHSSKNLSILIDRTSSHLMKLRCLSPPSGGLTSTCQGIALSLDVTDSTTTNPDAP